MIRKIICALLAFVLLMVHVSCGSNVDPTLSGAVEQASSDTEPAINVPDGELVLPRLMLKGNIKNMWDKADVRTVSVEYIEDGKSFEGYATLKVQGHSSLVYDKKNYTIKFFKDEECEKKNKVDLGWGEQNEYCLKANWIDKTHSRNIVSAKLASEVQAKYGVLNETPHNGTIDGYPIEIYSDGKFLGIYTMNIPKDEWMFNMDKDNPNHLVFCAESWDPACIMASEPDYTTWEIEVGEKNEENLNKLKRLYNFVSNSSDEEFKRDFEKYVDLDAALNYYILTQFMFLPDNMGKNMLLVTYDGEIWYPSLYDLDTSWGVDWTGSDVYDYESWNLNWDGHSLFGRMTILFADEIYDRYIELRSDILTEEHVMELFESFEASIPEESFIREGLKWGEDIPGYDISQIREYLRRMMPILDAKLENIKLRLPINPK